MIEKIILGIEEDEEHFIDLRDKPGWLIAGDLYVDRALALSVILEQLIESENTDITVINSRGGGILGNYQDKVNFYVENISIHENFIKTLEKLDEVRSAIGDDKFRIVIIDDADTLFSYARVFNEEVIDTLSSIIELIARKMRLHGALIISSDGYKDDIVPIHIQDNCDGRIAFKIDETEDRDVLYPNVEFNGVIPDPWLIDAADFVTAVVGDYNDPGAYVTIVSETLDEV